MSQSVDQLVLLTDVWHIVYCGPTAKWTFLKTDYLQLSSHFLIPIQVVYSYSRKMRNVLQAGQKRMHQKGGKFRCSGEGDIPLILGVHTA